ncbi:ankyrin [Fusarium mexicanum]|uniref:Ankyrin n=1 Tax=Fusarium mexicanum TaxID=751941 RepID=A0A8H5MTW1_9HYPO|nr:ankyrin [Fusarium mexicanum]
MEVTGLAVGVAGLAGLFSVCLDSLSRFQTYRDSNSETHVLDTRFRATRARFEQWGVSVGISDGRLQPDHHRGLDNKQTADLIESILQIIAKTICDESILQRSRTGPRTQSGQLGGLSQSRGKRLKWALGGKESRIEQVDVFEKLVQQLYNLIPPEEKGQSYEGLESTAWVEDIRQVLTKIEDGIKSEMQRDVLSWLGKSAPNDKYEDSLAKRVDTTCQWIFERPTFKSWLSPVDSTKPSVLWINGPAGFGKTVLSAYIVHHLSEALDTPVAHFFLTSDHESREDPFSALRSWHRQIAAKNDDAFECIRRAWENDSSIKASRKALVDLFRQVITAVPGCVFVADGLDECSQLGDGDASVARFLRDIMGAIRGTNARLLLVSRDEPEIREALREHREVYSEYRISTSDVQADTATFSQFVVNRKLYGKSEDLRLAISEAMTDRCQGQFLWLKLQEQSLRNTMSQKRLHEVVKNTPSGLDRLYDQNWGRIMNMPDQDRDRTFALLRWTAFTFVPVPIFVVIEAVLVDQFEELDPDDYPENFNDDYVSGEILGLCGPFIELRDNEEHPLPKSWTLHMPHFSVREYLVKHLPAPLWMQPKDIVNSEREMIHHTAMARACVQYLSLPQVWEEYSGSDLCLKAFLPYAVLFWMRHANLGFMDPSLRDLSKALLKSNHICFKSFVNYLVDHRGSDSDSTSMFQPRLGPLQLVFQFKWIAMAEHLLDDADVNDIGAHGRSPIFSACSSGSAESVKMLIRHGADLGITDDQGLTCLHHAAFYGFKDIVQILVESNVDVSSQDKIGVTPIHLAAAGGHVKCYQYLLEKGANADIRDLEGRNVVHHACFKAGNAQLLRFILQNGPDALATDHTYKVSSPLGLVARNGDVNMAKVLFEFGAVTSLFHPEFDGELPLQVAVSSGHIELVKLFLENGAGSTLSMPNADGNTALHIACAVTGRDKIISLLLRPGIDEAMLWGNDVGNTPLHVASGAGHASYVKLILQYLESGHQRLLEMQNKNLETPLLIAAEEGYVDVVKALLAHGAENTTHIFDLNKNSPLCVASAGGFSEILKELLLHGAGRTIAAFNSYGETPLHAAAIKNDVEVLKLLLEVPGVPLNQKTTYGFSPLFIASRNGYLSIVELLLSVDSVDRDSENWLGLGPFFAAVANGHLEVTKLFLSNGYHMQPTVSIGRDLLCPVR